MSSLVVAGDTSGSVTISAPAIAGSTTLTLPSSSGSGLLLNTSMNLISTITPTAVNSINSGTVNLTPYKSLYIVINGANPNPIAKWIVYVSSSNVQSGGGFSNTSNSAIGSLYGILLLDLATGAISGNAGIATITSNPINATFGGLTNVSTSTTTLYFRADSTNTFAASGSILIYGVY